MRTLLLIGLAFGAVALLSKKSTPTAIPPYLAKNPSAEPKDALPSYLPPNYG